MQDSADDQPSPSDWSQISSLWPENEIGQTKSYSDFMDFIDPSSLSMDMNFNPSMSIEPSALHFDPININTTYHYDPYSNDLLAPQFPFMFQSPYSPSLSSSESSPQLSAQGRRKLSITSSSSSSGVSDSAAVSEAAHSTDCPHITPENQTLPHTDVPMAELAERVRQSAGVMIALPIASHLQAQMNQQAASPVSNSTTTSKLPIPGLQRRASQSVESSSTVSSAASSPPPSTPSPPPESSPASGQAAALPRPPKTSHTTIERRYRTNLNARIQSLRMAVPALRVLEDREGKKKAPNKVLVSSEGVKLEVGTAQDVMGPGGIIDIIDERGFVDGVKIARKCSKANVLGKAVEYIRVLKKREQRLKNEQAGLKSLISGLVGGPALLNKWEREWKEIFGGAEKDEVDDELGAEADDDDSDEEQDDREEENGRKRKRGKTTATSGVKKEKEKVTAEPTTAAPEKRKRGRPRKIVPVAPPLPVLEQVQDMNTMTPQNHSPTPRYLLAMFALFSFINSPLTSTSPSSTSPHTHTGTVLNAPVEAVVVPWGLHNYVQMFHLLVSVIVLVSFVASWVGFGFDGSSVLSLLRLHNARKEKRTMTLWTKLGEQCVLGGLKQDPSLYTRIQIYHYISTWSSTSVEHLSTAAMALYGARGVAGKLAKTKARTAWINARAIAQLKSGAYERMVLEELSIDEAVDRIPYVIADKEMSPLQLLGTALVKERVRKHLGLLFIRSIAKDVEDSATDTDKAEREDTDRQNTIDAAKELGGQVGELGRTLERLWKLGRNSLVEVRDVRDDDAGVDGEIQALLTALVLFGRLFPASLAPKTGVSAMFSPSTDINQCDAGMLRRVLDSRVFEESDELEDVRDHAVDMVVELERRSVGLD
ncbi:hypothetical protein L208DRAFT_1375635 [Tricholoma matsutake]|nr:hypothetical protein L208DRAFT_1375635 [Tricholoma matsutake 945]